LALKPTVGLRSFATNGVGTACMKPLKADQQLPVSLEYSVALQALKPKSSPRRGRGLDASNHRGLTESSGEVFSLDILSHRMSVMAMFRQLSTSPQSPANAVTPAESRTMLLYNGSRVHNAKYELVGTCQGDWAFRLVFVLVQERPRSIVWTRGGKRQWVSIR